VACDLLNQGQNEKIKTRGAMEQQNQFGLNGQARRRKIVKEI